MPTRVLDIGNCDDSGLETSSRAPIKLVESIDIAGDRTYACLSHRWESYGRTLKTEGATYTTHQNGIAFEDLDLAYQDTVHIMRRLGVRYLWIDSLCIVQDDVQDWEAESKTMAMVYAKARFTLARHCNSNTSIQHTDNKPAHLVSDPCIAPPVFARIQPAHFWSYSFNVKRYPSAILGRGWVYQERLLSPRVIHLTEHEILWECYQVNTCQCKGPLSAQDLLPKLEHARALALVNRTAVTDESAIRKRWRNMVAEYSELNLTKPSDRLRAIQGCAEQIRELLKDSYFSGLWERSTAEDLAWSTRDRGQRPTGLFQVPSWSWASVAGSVWYAGAMNETAQVKLSAATDNPCQGQTSTYWLVKGQMVPGKLKLAERVEPDSTAYDTWTSHGMDIQVALHYLEPEAKTLSLAPPMYRFDADFDLCAADWSVESWYDIEIIQIGITWPRREHVCLILWRFGRAIPGSNHDRETKDGWPIYQRIGVLRMESLSMFLLEPQGASRLDWSKAKEVSIALE